MKALFITVFGLIMLMSASATGMPGLYDVEVSVAESDDDEVEVYSIFTAAEGEYGGIELVFYNDKYSYSIRAIEDVKDLIADPQVGGVKTGEKNIRQIVRIFAKPTATQAKGVRLTGKVITMVNTAAKGEPLFRLEEKPLELLMADDELESLVIEPKDPGRKVILDLVLRVKDGEDRTVVGSDVKFSASYSLFNESRNKYEVKGEPCQLTIEPGDADENTLCRHSRMYRLSNGDSLLYIVDYDIDAAKIHKNGSTDFTIGVTRYFFENPISFFSRADNDRRIEGADYGSPNRSIDTKTTINGKSRRVSVEIESGRVSSFRLDNIWFTPRDIVRSWDDIVGILKKIETTGDYAYLRPELDDTDATVESNVVGGFLASPDNYTADRLTTTSYSKSITLTNWEKAEIEIPFTKSNKLPFDGYEIITLERARVGADDWD